MTRFAFACLFALLTLPTDARAVERILAYDSVIEVRDDGSLEVSETITVRAEGRQIRRGIYRDFPTRYTERHGNRMVVGFEVLGVTRDGKPEPWFTEDRRNGVRVNTGNDDFLPVPAEYTYRIRYRTTRQLGFFDEHDELYFNAIGHDWAFPIETGSVEVRLPQPVPVDAMRAEGYTGAQGDRGRAFTATLPQPGVARWRLTQPLAPQQGFTIVLSFPKGLVPEPGDAQETLWLLNDNLGVLVALAALLALLGYCIVRWRQVGRDPRAGTIIARYEPPPDHGPAGLRYVMRMSCDDRCFTSDLLALAVAGKLRIQREDGLLQDKWQLQRSHDAGDGDDGAITPSQRTLLGKLFPGDDDVLELTSSNAATISQAKRAHFKALKARYQPQMFKRNDISIAIALAILMVGIGLALVLSRDGGGGLLAVIAIAVLMLAVLITFATLIKAPTVAGRRLLDEIEGLKRYLGVAEGDELAGLPGPGAPPALDARRYEQLLPYAVALDVEEAWTGKFTIAVGAATAAAATSGIAWYHGSGATDLGSLSRAVGSSLSSQIASSSSPPGSASGGGGGGFSGGGGGGGGGGGR